MGNLNKILVGTVLVALLMSLPLSVFAQSGKPPTPEFTVQYDSNSQHFVITIKNIDYDLPSGYDIHYNILANTDCYEYGSYSWGEAYHDYYPVQDPSGYTTIKLQPNYQTNGNHRFDCEVQALVCHYETETSSSLAHFGQKLNVTIVDSKSDWSSPQSLTADINYRSNDPTSVAPVPTQTPTPYQHGPNPTQTATPYPQNPTTNSNIWDNPFTALFNSDWEKLALLALTVIIVMMAAGLVLLWRKVGNLSANKQPA